MTDDREHLRDESNAALLRESALWCLRQVGCEHTDRDDLEINLTPAQHLGPVAGAGFGTVRCPHCAKTWGYRKALGQMPIFTEGGGS